MTPSLTRRLLRRTPTPAATVRWLRVEPMRLARALANLGPVLCLWSEPLPPGRVGGRGLLAGAPELQVLVHAGYLCHACAVTPDGPREWLTACDGAGIARLQLHLLPDTDYLAWDALLADARELGALGPTPLLRAAHARRLRFVTQPLGPCELLCVRPGGPSGELSVRMARALAWAEGARLRD